MATNYDKAIKKATTATKPSVSTKYTSGTYEKANNTVNKTAQTNVNNATTNAQNAYKQAVASNTQRSAEVSANNNTLIRQVGTSMKRRNYSLTNRNVASAASARSAAANAAALAAANRNAEVTRDTTTAKAKATIYKQKAQLNAGNTEKDIARSTQLNKTKSQQKFQAKEAQKSRDLKNAVSKREKAYNKTQRQLASYSSTLEARYTSVNAINKAIKKMKASNDKQKSEKLAYLRALKVKLQQGKASGGSSGGGGRRGGRRGGYSRRGWGSSGSSNAESIKLGGDNTNKDDTTKKVDFNLTRAYQYARGEKAGKKANGVERMYAQKQKAAMNIVKDSKKIAESRAKWKNKAKSTATSVRWRGATARKK